MSQSERQLPIVMVVDDNPSIRDMVSWALELDGYETIEAANGQEALAWMDSAAREGRYPAVILLDLAMPAMDGYTFLQRLREQWEKTHSLKGPEPPLPAIVIITAGTKEFDEKAWGVQHVVVKPFHVRDLLDIIHNLTS